MIGSDTADAAGCAAGMVSPSRTRGTSRATIHRTSTRRHEERTMSSASPGKMGRTLAELAFAKGYRVHGIKFGGRSTFNTGRIDRHPRSHRAPLWRPLRRLSAPLLHAVLHASQPDEIYNLGEPCPRHFVRFEMLEYTTDVNASGVVRLLEAARLGAEVALHHQASTSSRAVRQSRRDPADGARPFHPRSPYGCEGVRVLRHARTTRGGQDVLLQRHPLQPREPSPPGELVRYPQPLRRAVGRIVAGEVQQRRLELGNSGREARFGGNAPDCV